MHILARITYNKSVPEKCSMIYIGFFIFLRKFRENPKRQKNHL